MSLLRNHNNAFEKKLKKQLDDTELKPSESLWDRIDKEVNRPDFEGSVEGKIGKYEITPSPETWSYIEQQLPPEPSRWKRAGKLWYGIALLLFMGGAMIGYQLSNLPEQDMAHVPAVTVEPSDTEQQEVKEIIGATDQQSAEWVEEPAKKNVAADKIAAESAPEDQTGVSDALSNSIKSNKETAPTTAGKPELNKQEQPASVHPVPATAKTVVAPQAKQADGSAKQNKRTKTHFTAHEKAVASGEATTAVKPVDDKRPATAKKEAATSPAVKTATVAKRNAARQKKAVDADKPADNRNTAITRDNSPAKPAAKTALVKTPSSGEPAFATQTTKAPQPAVAGIGNDPAKTQTARNGAAAEGVNPIPENRSAANPPAEKTGITVAPASGQQPGSNGSVATTRIADAENAAPGIENTTQAIALSAPGQALPQPGDTTKTNKPGSAGKPMQQVSDTLEKLIAPDMNEMSPNAPARLSISIMAGLHQSNMRLVAPSNGNLNENVALRKQTEAPKTDFTGGFLIDYKVNEHVLISSGIMFTGFSMSMKYNTTPAGKEATPEPGATYTNASDSIKQGSGLNNRIHYSWNEIPLFVTFRFNPGKRFGFETKTGVSYAILSTVDAAMVGQENIGVLLLKNKESFPHMKNGAFVHLYVGASCQLNESVALQLMPYFKYSITNMVDNDTWVKQYPWMMGISLGLRKSF